MTLPTLTVHRLRRDEFLHFGLRQPVRLQADCGSLWVTQDGEPDDIQLDAGTHRDFDGHARLTVGTLGGDAQVSVMPLQRGGWMQGLLQALGAWRPAAVRTGRAVPCARS